MNTFNIDFQKGKIAEYNTQLILKHFGYNSDLNISNYLEKLKEYDIRYTANTETVKTIECKKDSWTDQTGNIAIEFIYKNKYSGIMTTKSNYLFYFSDTKLYIFNTNHLKYFFLNEFGILANAGFVLNINDNTYCLMIPIKLLFAFKITCQIYDLDKILK